VKRVSSTHLEHLTGDISLEYLAQATCAFLNSGGGTIMIRAHDLAEAERLKTRIAEDMRGQIHPGAFWTVAVQEDRNEAFCILDVPTGRDRPYSAKGTIYRREGSETLEATGQDIQQMVETGYREVERWERRPLSSDTIERLDKAEIEQTVKQGVEIRNFKFTAPEETATVLRELGLYRQGAATNASEVLFGVRPAIQFPQVRARVTVYAAEKGGEFIDSRVFEASVFVTLEAVLGMIRQHTPVASSFPAGLRREDRKAYHEQAVREGLVNAFVHRDYADASGGVSVDLYPDRLVIWNSGQLPPGIKIGDLKREHPSMPRNPDIAQVFWLRGYMERVGRGTQNIVNWCGSPAPQWKSDETGVTLTFFNPQAKVRSPKLNLREKKLIATLTPGTPIKQGEYCERFAVSERQARRDLSNLVDEGWMIREGDGPTTVFRRTAKPAESGQT
jgi:ATP-dependent DNA helicase RecG